MVLIGMTEIAVITWQVSAWTGDTFGFLLGNGSSCSCSIQNHDISCQAGYWKARVEEIQGQKLGATWFPIDLGISLLNYDIGLDWDGESRERPSYMWKGPFKPCECKMCFFFVKGLTNGITHRPSKGAKVMVEYVCGMWVKTDKCTNVRVSLGMKSRAYCQMCYRKQVTIELHASERIKRCRTAAMGYAICKEPICKECWKEGYDKHE